MREMAATGAFTEPERYRSAAAAAEADPTEGAARARREHLDRGARSCDRRAGPSGPSRRLGISDRHHHRVRPALARLHGPGAETFLHSRIYPSFAQTTPYFALVALPLTMVIVSGDIDLSFPSTMALGMVGFLAI